MSHSARLVVVVVCYLKQATHAAHGTPQRTGVIGEFGGDRVKLISHSACSAELIVVRRTDFCTYQLSCTAYPVFTN